MSETNNSMRAISLGALCEQLPLGTHITLHSGSTWELRKDFDKNATTYLISLTRDTPTLTLNQAHQFYVNGDNLHVTLPNSGRRERLDIDDTHPVGG